MWVTGMSEESVRSFLAIELSEEMRSGIGRFLEGIALEHFGFRGIPPKNWHLTIHFFGTLKPSEIDTLKVPLAKTCQLVKPFKLTANDFGAFPSDRNPQILWLGLRGELDALSGLKQGIDRVLETLGFAVEKRAFKAHVTVARAKKRRTEFPAAMRQCVFSELFEVKVSDLVLFRSILSSEGAHYERLHHFLLGV